MSTITREFTKEQLIERCKEAIASLKPCVGIAETKSLACFEIALASLEAEDKLSSFVASQVSLGSEFEKVLAENLHDLYVDCDNSKPAPKSEAVYQVCKEAGIWVDIESDNIFSLQLNGEQVRTLFTAPPVPVSVPEKLPCDLENEWSLVDTANKNNSIPDEKIKGDDFELNGPLSCYQAGKIDGWNNYRAAMLQGAERVSNRDELPDGWVACSERMPDADGNYWGWWSESKQQGTVWFTKTDSYSYFQSSEITHWMPLPAAPQQEC